MSDEDYYRMLAFAEIAKDLAGKRDNYDPEYTSIMVQASYFVKRIADYLRKADLVNIYHKINI